MTSALLAPADEVAIEAATRRQFLTLLGTSGLLTACASGPAASPTGPTTRTVRHAFGTTEVPTAPQRIIAALGQQELELLLALGTWAPPRCRSRRSGSSRSTPTLCRAR